jgi:hypothetical protein
MQLSMKNVCTCGDDDALDASILSLKEKLLAIGGERISAERWGFGPLLVLHGCLIDLPVRLRRMDTSRCHGNVAHLWDCRTKSSRLKGIATGYGLSDDGMWRPHSWGLTATHIVETTEGRLRYFGIRLAGEAADYFTALTLTETDEQLQAKMQDLRLKPA